MKSKVTKKSCLGDFRSNPRNQSYWHIKMRDGGGRQWGPDEMSEVLDKPGKGSGPFSSDLRDCVNWIYAILSSDAACRFGYL